MSEQMAIYILEDQIIQAKALEALVSYIQEIFIMKQSIYFHVQMNYYKWHTRTPN